MTSRVTAIVAVIAAGLLLLVIAPVLLIAAASTAAQASQCNTTPLTGPIGAVLQTIRTLESNGDYTARAPGSSASGAYQFIDSTWNNYGGFARAVLAPPEVQDAKAAEDVTRMLNEHGQDIRVVPVLWYIGHLPGPESPEWDTVPAPGAGNRLTPREYQSMWVDTYQQIASGGAPAPAGGSPAGACSGSATIVGNYALPVDVGWYQQHPEWFTKPHHDYPAADLPLPAGEPIFAAIGGVVVSAPAGGGCGEGVIIDGDDGNRWTYCHGTRPLVAQGARVNTGDPIMISGYTGTVRPPGPGGAHLHLQIQLDHGRGALVCPQPALVAWATGQASEAITLPTSGCTS